MLAFILQINAWLQTGRIFLFAFLMLLIWLLWLLRVTLASYYRPWQGSHQATTSVIVPVVDEPEDQFRSVLDRIIEQRPTEVIVIINGPRNAALEKICADVGVRWIWTEVPGKRNALRVGIGMATGDIAVLVDSDTIWTPETLCELVKPFRDPRVGGVTTRQRIFNPGRSILTRWADWLENVRNEYSMPAMSVLGTVGFLPGRTIAFRRHILVKCMDRFLTERFLGVHIEVSDDRALTNYTLMAGYKTVFQSTSLVYTDAPTKLGKLTKQQYRWARGSQYNTLRMLPWMLRHAPVLALLYALHARGFRAGAFADPVGVLTRDQVLQSVSDSSRWAQVSFEDTHIIHLSDDTCILSYKARAHRSTGHNHAYIARACSAYVRRNGNWKMAFHQQTPTT
jgi:hyaluronan synthase